MCSGVVMRRFLRFSVAVGIEPFPDSACDLWNRSELFECSHWGCGSTNAWSTLAEFLVQDKQVTVW